MAARPWADTGDEDDLERHCADLAVMYGPDEGVEQGCRVIRKFGRRMRKTPYVIRDKLANREFTPDWAVPPGDTIRRLLQRRDVTLQDLQAQLPKVDVRALVEGTLRIDQDIARVLADFIGPSVAFWLRREAQYRETLRTQ